MIDAKKRRKKSTSIDDLKKKKKPSFSWVYKEHTSVKSLCDNSTGNIILNSEKLKALPLISGISVHLSPLLVNIV